MYQYLTLAGRLAIITLIAIVMSGCATTAESNSKNISKIESEWRSYHQNLDELKQLGTHFNTRLFSYTPTFLFDYNFGDVTVSNRKKGGYIDLLDVKLASGNLTGCRTMSARDIKDVKQATECSGIYF